MVVFATLVGGLTAANAAPLPKLENDHIVATFGPRGLVSIRESGKAVPGAIRFDTFSLEVDNDRFESSAAKAEINQSTADEISYSFQESGYVVDVIYRIEPKWQFITKQIRLVSTPQTSFMVREIRPVDLSFANRIDSVFIPGIYLPQYGPPNPEQTRPTKEFGIFTRFSTKSGVMGSCRIRFCV